jgi:hypothetical protein
VDHWTRVGVNTSLNVIFFVLSLVPGVLSFFFFFASILVESVAQVASAVVSALPAGEIPAQDNCYWLRHERSFYVPILVS